MRLTQRLLLGALALVGVFGVLAVAIIDLRLRQRLYEYSSEQLLRASRAVAASWDASGESGGAPDEFADRMGAAMGLRVTLVDSAGVVVGDSEFDVPSLAGLENHRDRPEVRDALASGSGLARRVSPSAGDEELYAAVRAGRGVARTSLPTTALREPLDRAERDVAGATLAVAALAMALAALFSRSVARPIIQLRDVARSLAAGDLSRRAPLSAPGEVGDLAAALHSLSEQLSTRLRALEAEEMLVAALTDALDEGVIAVDSRQQVVRMNVTARTLTGLTGPLPFPSDLLPRDRIFREALVAALRGDSTDAVELELGERIVALTARPLTEPAGGAVLALFDLTQIRRLEAVRRDFVANVSHELRTPLTVVGGFAETLASEDHIPEEQRRQFASTILTHTQRMHRLVSDLLDLSRIESGGWKPAPVATDVATLAREVLTMMRDEADRKSLELREEVAADAATLFADPVALRQVLTNLVENAVRYTNAGSVTVFARRRDDEVRIGVRDTGTGIPTEHLPRIFERFYRVDAGRSRAEGGTGLGLAIVRHIAEAHGGRVGAESAPGRGTTIWVELPARRGVTPV